MIRPPKWVVLKPPPDGAKTYNLQTAESAIFAKNSVDKTGRKVEVSIAPDESLRTFGVTDEFYVVGLPKRASDGSSLVLIPKSLVREVRANK